jgi:hypothetical protein
VNAVTTLRHAGAQQLPASTLQAWCLDAHGKHALPHEVATCSLAELERQVAHATYFGATFFVVETGTISRKSVLHVYRIRRGSKAIGYDPVTGNKRYAHTADKLFALPVDAFEPTQPWRWSPGADVVGGDPNVIDIWRAA